MLRLDASVCVVACVVVFPFVVYCFGVNELGVGMCVGVVGVCLCWRVLRVLFSVGLMCG